MNIRYTKEDIEVVIATMNRNTLDFLVPMFPLNVADISILIINQTHEKAILISDRPNVRVINSFEKGLSKSRNLGLSNAKGKLLVLADDDEVFHPNFPDAIITGYQQFPNAVAIGFQIESVKGKLFKKYATTVKSHLHSLDLFSMLSIEISINKAIFDKTKVIFEERFGLGAPFKMGEEAIFLMDLYRLQQQISFVPKVIATHEAKTTTDKVDFLQRYYIQGAFLSRVQGQNFGLRLLQKIFFDVKQKKLRLTETPKAIQQALQGRHDFLQNIQ